jgi:membrane fusion protein, multidrug efflux system
MQSRRWMVVGVACVTVFAVLAAIKVMQIRAAIAFAESFPEPFETVEIALAQTQAMGERVTVLGSVVAPQSIELRNELEGRITQVGFVSGSRVTRGQILLQLDASEEQAQLAAAQAQAQLAHQALQRYSRLIKTNASSKDQYDQALAQYEVAQATAQALQARIDKKTLRAPFDAQAGLHQLDPGQFLAANTPITQLVGISDKVWVDFYLGQKHARLESGAIVHIGVPDSRAKPLEGSVIARDAMVSSTSRNLRFRAEIADAGHLLTPGSAVDVAIDASPTMAIVVPATALRYDASGNHVFVIRESAKPSAKTDGAADASPKQQWRAEKRAVTPGLLRDGTVVISEGLSAGEHVAANGSYKLRDGVSVNPVMPAQPGVQP